MKRGLEFGIALPAYCGPSWENDTPTLRELIEFCVHAERLGFKSVWQLEHLTTGKPTYNCSWYEPLITLSSIISSIKEMRIGTSVLILPLRNPAVLAKQVVTLDVLSNGRLTLGVGVGWHDKEFELCGIDMRERGQRLEESIKVLKELLSEETASHTGKFWRFSDIEFYPKPVQRPHPPIIIGAGAYVYRDRPRLNKLLRRVVTLGDGWFATSFFTPEPIKECIETLKHLLTEIGKDPANFVFMHHKFAYLTNSSNASDARKIVSRVIGVPLEDVAKVHLVCSKDEFLRRLERYSETGLTHLNVIPFYTDYELLEFVSAEVIPHFQP